MLILSLFIVFHVLSSFFSLELNGEVSLSDRILKAFKKPSGMIEDVVNEIPTDISGKGDLSNELSQSVDPNLIKIYEVVNRTNDDEYDKNEVKKKTKCLLKDFFNHLLKKGRKALKNIATQIVIDLKIKRNITAILKIVSKDFTQTLQSYYEFVKKHQHETKRDFLYLDVVETSCRLLYNEQKKLLNDIIMHETQKDQRDNYHRLAHKLLELSKKARQDVMAHLCQKYKICRHYPSFTDYFSNLASEIFALSNEKLHKIVEILMNIFKKKETAFAKVTEKVDRELIAEKLRRYSLNMHSMREIFAVARAVINHRYKTIQSGNEELTLKTKATCIILDIIDKALHSDDDLLAIDFDNSVQAIRSWAAGKRNYMNNHLEEFATSFQRRFEHNLTENARNELKALIKVIMRGMSPNDYVAASLFKHGSSYVNGEDFHPDVDIMSI